MLSKLHTLLHSVLLLKNWWVFVGDYLGFYQKNKLIDLKTRGGITLTLRAGTTDRGTFGAIWIKKMYLPRNFSIPTNGTIIDCGGHIGIFTLWVYNYFVKNGPIFVFEPDPENFKLLKKNVSQNKCRDVTLIKKALSKIEGEINLYISDREPDCHNIFINESGKIEKILSTTMSAVIAAYQIKKIDFFKLDCEGAEYEIFYTLPYNYFSTLDYVALEFHQKILGQNPTELAAYIEKQGFEVYFKDSILYANRTTR